MDYAAVANPPAVARGESQIPVAVSISVLILGGREDNMPSKVPQSHNQKKKGKSIQERRAEKRAKKAGLGSPGLRLGTGNDRSGASGGQGSHS